MAGRYTFSIFHVVTGFTLAVAAVPADPTITARAILPRQQTDDQFIGYSESRGLWYSEDCNAGLNWVQNSQYAQCCAATLSTCYAATACVSGTLLFPLPVFSTVSALACTDNYADQALSICNTAFIFESFGDMRPKTDIICGSVSEDFSFYRRLPASATLASSKAPLSIPQPASTGFRPLATPSDDSSSEGSKSKSKSKSKAWIAGAVVGPIVGLALIGLLVFCCLRRRRKNKNTAPQQGSAAMAAAHPNLPPAGVAGHTDAKPQPITLNQNLKHADPYLNTGLYASQGNYSNAPLPAPAYAQSYVGMPPQNAGAPASYNAATAPYNASTTPYTAPASAPPQQTHYSNDPKQQYVNAPDAGKPSSGSTSGQKTQSAELSGSATGAAAAAPPSALPPGKTSWMDALTN